MRENLGRQHSKTRCNGHLIAKRAFTVQCSSVQNSGEFM